MSEPDSGFGRKDNALEFDAMDAFMSFVLKAIEEHGSRAVRVFPPPSQVLISFAERIAQEVVSLSSLHFNNRSIYFAG